MRTPPRALRLAGGPACAAIAAALAALAAAAPGEGAQAVFRGSLLAAAPLPEPDRYLVVGHLGQLGRLEVGAEAARFRPIESGLDEDLVCAEPAGDGSVLVGSSAGRVLRYRRGVLEPLAEISDKPVLDVKARAGTIWAVGGRGLVARSGDAGRSWTKVAPEYVEQPPLRLPATEPASWSLGVSNIDEESFTLEARVEGRPAEPGRDWSLSAADGRLDVRSPLDAEPWPQVAFRYRPGAPFQGGDVTWNVVLVHGEAVTLAGEFGSVLESRDGGESWRRRHAILTQDEPRVPYWIYGAVRGKRLLLVGAAGAAAESGDGGASWRSLDRPSDDGLFGAYVTEGGTPVVAGAVGVVGALGDEGWELADRTRLRLFSWLTEVLPAGDGRLLAMGGRGTLVRWSGGSWHRIPIVQGDAVR